MIERLTACASLFHSRTELCYSFYQIAKFLESKYFSASYSELDVVTMEILVSSTSTFQALGMEVPSAIPIVEEAPEVVS